jgi:hypothetical protein
MKSPRPGWYLVPTLISSPARMTATAFSRLTSSEQPTVGAHGHPSPRHRSPARLVTRQHGGHRRRRTPRLPR